jgi:hypothetical protein
MAFLYMLVLLKIGASLAKIWRELSPLLFYPLLEIILPVCIGRRAGYNTEFGKNV